LDGTTSGSTDISRSNLVGWVKAEHTQPSLKALSWQLHYQAKLLKAGNLPSLNI